VAKNIIQVRPTGDYHDEFRPGVGIIPVDDYEIVSCDVDAEHGNFEYVVMMPPMLYDSKLFPPGAFSLPKDIPRSRNVHVSKLQIIGDLEIQQLRSEGVEVIILPE
jgi:hypothetical protein